jgi:integrase
MKYLQLHEEKTLLKTVGEIKGKRAQRDGMIIYLALNTGLRCSEILGLNVGDVRGKERLYVRKEMAKGGKPRLIPIHKDLQIRLKSFIKFKLMWKEEIQDDAPLFISRLGNRISKRGLQDLVEYWCCRAGLTVFKSTGKRSYYSVHSLRHTFAKRLEQRGVRLPAIQKLLGHAILASTGIYTEADEEETQEAVETLSSYRSKGAAADAEAMAARG